MKLLIADDELPARERLARLVEKLEIPGIELLAAVTNGREAVDYCQQNPVDVVLMDIRMPEMDGLQAAAILSEESIPPAVIFTTAYDQYALDAFEASGAGYLLKPIKQQALNDALQKLWQLNRAQLSQTQLNQTQLNQTQFILGSYRGAKVREAVDKVIYFQAEQKYVVAHTADKTILMDVPLKALEAEYVDKFVRVHRNALVAREKIYGVKNRADGQAVVLLTDCDDEIEVSRRHLSEVKKLMTKNPK